MVTALWHKESYLKTRPDGDAGPGQLTSAVKQFAIGNAYGSWKGRTKDVPFDGDIIDNVTTVGNIVTDGFTRHGGNFGQIAYWYGPDREFDAKGKLLPTPANVVRTKYKNAVIPKFNLYRPFYNCLSQKK